ncbi:hypothetical protein [Streptomyces sp. WM6378]|uniref:hypothetical protein n=1 Tax=Streptomyces sp. WM6378 TaxID=1415557 RepID=UPI0006AEA7F1|nr:hypothetical protein [Streptomyces sp. WM6378]KOU40145.1 hypothetical protein ADK54_23380 [Streptomyces sp. WM6378]
MDHPRVTLEPGGIAALLLGPAVVLVPAPPAMADGLTAVVRPVPAGLGPVERIAVVEREVAVAEDGQLTSSAGLLRLGEASSYAAQGEACTPQRLAEALRRHRGDLWSALAEFGYVGGRGGGVQAAALAAAFAVAPGGPEPAAPDRVFASVEEFAARCCAWRDAPPSTGG